MRILMLNYEYPPIGGGAAPVTRALSERLAAADHAVDVVTMGYGRLPFHEQFVDGRLNVYRVPALRRSPVRAVTVEMASYLLTAFPWALWRSWQTRYDLIHAHFLMPTTVIAAPLARLRNLPLIVTIHGSDVPGYNPDRFKRGHKLLAPLWRRLVQRTDAIISPSRYLGNLLQQGCPAEVTIIPNGFDPPPIPLPERKKRILFVSRLFPRKGAHLLIQALEGMDLTGWEVMIAGDGPMLADLKQQAAQAGVPISFPGFVTGPALYELYASSEIFVFPSLHDNFPVVLLEALSAGCAIVASNTTGVPEVVEQAGLTVRPHAIPELRAAIARLMADDTLRAELRARTRERIRELSWTHVLQQHLDLYQRVLERRTIAAVTKRA